MNRDRLWATAIVWFAMMVIVGVFLGETDMEYIGGGNAVFIVLTMATAATIATGAIWIRAGSGVMPQQPVQLRADDRKSKRLDPRRVERLVETLDEDEIVELETLLLGREDQRQRR